MEAKNHCHLEEKEQEQHCIQAEHDHEQQEEIKMEADHCLQIDRKKESGRNLNAGLDFEWWQMKCKMHQLQIFYLHSNKLNVSPKNVIWYMKQSPEVATIIPPATAVPGMILTNASGLSKP